jgi:predicted ArsR family transcriptional regulator
MTADLFNYPNRPGFKEHGGTSEDAAASVAGKSPLLRDLVLEALSCEPMTADETAKRLGKSVLSIRPRLSELRAMGKIVATPVTRPNASGKQARVWRVK